jgi:phosphopantothenoylcysteine decarboxylase/phosphopantothenate--cysteine ligase
MRVIVGVCGSIAAYKSVELVRELQQRGADVSVAMTRSASRFVGPLTFAALTGHTVYTSLWQPSGEDVDGYADSIEHVTAGQGIDALVIAPATANTIAKLANGVANDFLSALYLATKAPVVIAPAMNVNMWQHPATQTNVKILRDRGAFFIEPESGYLACGMTGGGRLAPLETIADAVFSLVKKRNDLADETVLITAGGTREPIDPVRYLGNRSSGRMGYALAEEAIARGSRVTLVTASSLTVPQGCKVVRVETAAEMSAAVLEHLPASTIVIKAAAVADYRVLTPAQSKLRRSGPITLELIPTDDIVAEAVKKRSDGTLIVAFAAETEDMEVNARTKLLRKGVDAIVANDVAAPGLGFDSERNSGLFITEESTVTLPESSKREMAGRILDEIKALRLRVPDTGRDSHTMSRTS